MKLFKRRDPDPPERGMHISLTNHPQGSTTPMEDIVREALQFTGHLPSTCRCGPSCCCRSER